MGMTEPLTMVTDYLLAITSITCALLLLRRGGTPYRAWAAGLAFAGVASFLGGTYHGWFSDSTSTGPRLLWISTMLSIGCAACALLVAAGQSWFAPSSRRVITIVAGLILVAYAAWVVSHVDFVWAIVDYGSTMLFILGVAGFNAFRGDRGAALVSAGIVVSFVAAAIQQLPVRVGPLNHNDVYHLVQIVGILVIYAGAGRLRPAGGSATISS